MKLEMRRRVKKFLTEEVGINLNLYKFVSCEKDQTLDWYHFTWENKISGNYLNQSIIYDKNQDDIIEYQFPVFS